MERRPLTAVEDLSIHVLAGGHSGERRYNLRAGHAVLGELLSNGVDAMLSEIGRSSHDDARVIAGLARAKPDFVLLCVTEEVPIQGTLDLLGIPYNGSGPAGSLLSLDKVASGEALRREGLRVPRVFDVVCRDRRDRGGWASETTRRIAGRRVVVKPRDSGCSLGVTTLERPSKGDVESAVRYAAEFSSDVLVEEHIDGIEITIGVIGDRVLPPVRPSEASGLYTSGMKWEHAQTDDAHGLSRPHVTEIDLPEEEIIAIVGRVRRAVGLRNAWRLDAVMTSTDLCILEVNALPKLAAPLGEMAVAAEAAGLSFFALLATIITDALPSTVRQTAGSPGETRSSPV